MKFSKKVYKNTPEYALYIKARFADRTSHSFEFDGHRWAYEHTRFDDAGNYDLLYRFTDDEVSPVETSDDLSLHDYFSAKAMAAIIANPSLIGDLGELSVGWIVGHSRAVADAMIKARG
ncbi:hypothetical protein AB8884_22200 [Yersinia enterocolitica]|uniref:hypothetical protein n=1 Tax=Yersinia enterocolitica TaxID=630 RepID=UPI003CFCD896